MTSVTVPQAQPNDELNDVLINMGPNAIAEVVNGNLDDSNISSLTGTKIASGTLPAASMTADANPETRMAETLGNSIASGCVWSTLTGLNGAMTAGVAYVNGKRLVVSAVASYTFTASRDTYVYISDTGSVQYNAVANNADMPATPANHALVARVITNASAITSVIASPDKPQGDRYSLSERLTGKYWIDGRPIYRKVVNFGALPNNTTKSVAHGITGMLQLVDLMILAAEGSNYAPIPWASVSQPIQTNVNGTGVAIVTTSNLTTFTRTYAILEYTRS